MTLIIIDIDEPIGGLLYEGICFCLRAFQALLHSHVTHIMVGSHTFGHTAVETVCSHSLCRSLLTHSVQGCNSLLT